MSAPWKIVRVFISSTFRDMHAERDQLVRFVFPRLRDELLPRRIHLVDVDLRWGVTGEQDATEVCREVIEECRPRFLCILGGRYGTIPPGKDLSITADEVHFGVLDERREKIYALFYFRDGAATRLMDMADPESARERHASDKARKLARLKRAIRNNKWPPIRYAPRWDPDEERLLDLKLFGDRVAAGILATIDDEFGVHMPAQLDEFAEENAAMEAFVEERSERFVLGSRELLRDALVAHARATGGSGYLCLAGARGTGKSALLAHLSRHAPLRSEPSTLVIGHFVGASPGSTDIRRTLRRLCHELSASGREIAAIPHDLEQLRVAFSASLRRACARRRVVILIDAVNQFDLMSHSTRFHWLPEKLPANGRVILSAVDGPALEELRSRPVRPREIELRPLTADDGGAIIEQFRRRYQKTFEPRQRAELLAKTDAGTPLYLVAALEELRTLGTYDEINDRIAALPPTTPALFAWILARLERDDGFRDASGGRVGRELVPRFTALLGASRYGLSQRELCDLLDPGDPQGNVAALLHLLRPYLLRRGELVDFQHGQFRAAAEETWLKTEAERRAAHARLVTYFRDQADPEKNRSWKGVNARPFLELPFHMRQGQMWEELAATLTDLRFVEAKAAAGLTFDLVRDYDTAMRQWPHASSETARSTQLAMSRHAPLPLRAFGHFAFQHASALARDPAQVMAFAHNYAASGPVVEAAGDLLRRRSWKAQPWIELVDRRPFIEHPGLIHELRGHEGEVTAVAVSDDGHRAVSVSMDGSARIWNVLLGSCERTLVAHEQGVNAVALTPDGKVAATAGVDGLAKVWRVDTGDCLHSFTADRREALSIALNAQATAAYVGGCDGTISIWSLATGQRLSELRGHFGPVSALALSADGNTLASGSWDCMARVWDLESQRCTTSLIGHEVPVHGVAIDRVGVRIATCAGMPPDGDGRVSFQQLAQSDVRIWESNVEAYRLQPHGIADRGGRLGGVLGSVIYGVGLSQDGRVAVSVGYDRVVAVHTLGRRPYSRALVGHTDSVRSIAVDATGSVALTGGTDRTVRVWNLDGGTAPAQARVRIGRIGRGIRAAPAGHARLLWQNDRIRRVILLPIVSLVVGYLALPGLLSVLGWAPLAGSRQPSNAVGAYGMLLLVEWRAMLKLDSHAWHRPLLPGTVWALLGVVLLPLWWIFPVLNCPCCGARLCGRRRFFHCRACGFRDVIVRRNRQEPR